MLKFILLIICIYLCSYITNNDRCFAVDGSPGLTITGGTLSTSPVDIKAPEPGSFVAKYGFSLSKEFFPYIATGLAYTYKPDDKTGDIISLKTGIATQVGFRYLLGERAAFSLDYKYLSLSPEQQKSDIKTTPQSIGLGIDVKF